MQPITEVFKQFCKERHEEDKLLNKGKNFNYLQETYANTEFFDVSLYNKDNEDSPKLKADINFNKRIAKIDELVDFSLPFESNFIKFNTDYYIFIKEHSPNIIIGSLFCANGSNNFKVNNIPIHSNLTFNITLENNTFKLSFASQDLDILLKFVENAFRKEWYSFLKENNIRDLSQMEYAKEKYKIEWEKVEQDSITLLFKRIIITCHALNNLSKKSVVVDTPNTPQTEYYRRKHADTLKRYNRPIYYVLDKKEETKKVKYNQIESRGHLEFTHSFKVRGFWRKISEKSYGKDRQGNYIVLGYTWVVEHYRGKGGLIKKLRVIK